MIKPFATTTMPIVLLHTIMLCKTSYLTLSFNNIAKNKMQATGSTNWQQEKWSGLYLAPLSEFSSSSSSYPIVCARDEMHSAVTKTLQLPNKKLTSDNQSPTKIPRTWISPSHKKAPLCLSKMLPIPTWPRISIDLLKLLNESLNSSLCSRIVSLKKSSCPFLLRIPTIPLES